MFEEIMMAIAEVTVMIDGVAYAPVGFMAQELTKYMLFWGLLFGFDVWLGYQIMNHLVEGAVLLGRLILSKIRQKNPQFDNSERMSEVIGALHTMDPDELTCAYNTIMSCKKYTD